MQSSQTISCDCDTVSIAISGQPLFRVYCHCTTCQTYNDSPFADVSIFRATDVVLADDSSVEFQHYQKPALVQRGKCISCKTPSIENISMPILPNLRVIPSRLLPDELQKNITCHIFYHRRLQDADDNLPRHNGFISSQLAFMGALMKSIRAQRT